MRCDLQRTLLGRWDYHNGTETPRGSSLSKLLTVYSHDDTGLQVSQQEYYYWGLNGRLAEERTNLRDWSETGVMGPLWAVMYFYGPEGQIQQITYPHPALNPIGATVVNYGYEHGLLKTVSSNRTTASATFSYHPSGLIKEIAHGNGVKTTIEDDIRGRVERIAAGVPGSQPLWETGTHRYDGAGNVYEIGDTPLGADNYWKFGYDANQRLTWAKLKGYEIIYGYDKFGNMTSRSFTSYPAGSSPPPGMQFSGRGYLGNQITDTGFSYDGNGNLRDTPAVSANDRALAYDYDVRNRLTAVGPVDPSCTAAPCTLDPNAIRGKYRYTASGMRVSREDGTTGWVTFYFRDSAGEVLSEYARPAAGGTPAWSKDYVQGGGKQLAVVENGPPAAPGGFLTCAETTARECDGQSGSTAITLNWVDNLDTDIYGYRVYRASSATAFAPGSVLTPVHAGDLGVSTFVDLTPKSCTNAILPACWYAVTAVDRSGKEGPYSTPLAIRLNDTTAPGAPSQLRVDGVSTTTVSLSWNAPGGTPSEDFLGYFVRRRTDVEAYRDVHWVPVQGTSFQDVGLNCGATYYYQVVSVDTGSNRSAPTSEVPATTSTCGSGGDGDKKRAELNSGAADFWRLALVAAPHQSVGQSAPDVVVSTLHQDHLGSVRRITGSAGELVSRHDYFPFGKEIGPIQKSPSAHRFIGRDWDPESDLAYLMARYQNALVARFMTTDPGLAGADSPRPQTWNAYSYANNNPLKYVDTNGDSPTEAEVRTKIVTEAQRQGVDPVLALAVARTESNFDQSARNVNNDRARSVDVGVFQINSKNDRKEYSGVKIDHALAESDLDANIRMGIAILKEANDRAAREIPRDDQAQAAQTYKDFNGGASERRRPNTKKDERFMRIYEDEKQRFERESRQSSNEKTTQTAARVYVFTVNSPGFTVLYNGVPVRLK